MLVFNSIRLFYIHFTYTQKEKKERKKERESYLARVVSFYAIEGIAVIERDSAESLFPLGREYYNEKRTNLRSRGGYPLDTRPQSINREDFFGECFFNCSLFFFLSKYPLSTRP